MYTDSNKDLQRNLFESMHPKMTLTEVQDFFSEMLLLRGFNDDSIEEKMLLLIEEVGELAKALRKEQSGLQIDYNKIENYDTVRSELADVLIVLISISNLVDINLYEALYEKEKNNIDRKWAK